MQEFKNNKNVRNAVILMVVFFLGAISMFALVRFSPVSVTENIMKTVKDVTVTDTGIADAVSKVYDTVVTVETYRKDKLYATGTGFVYKNEGGKGFILTNNHVIENGDKIKVVFTNNNTVDAHVVGSDKYADIAVLTVDSSNVLSVAQIGNNTNSRLGDTVFAVGAPIDSSAYSWSVTRGILSGKDRMVEVSLNGNNSVSDWVMNVLQTDAAINSGNSGGPLSNSNGEVIGITSMKLASSSIEGMGFAITIEDALDWARRIENGESIVRPYLGISMYNLADILIRVEAPISSGVYIDKVEDGSPAAEAGFKTGDIIVKMGDAEIKSIAFLKYQLYKYNVGDSVKVSYYRGSELKETTIKLSKASE